MSWTLPNVGWALQIANIVVSTIWFVAVLYFRSSYVPKAEFTKVLQRLTAVETNGQLAEQSGVATKQDIGRIMAQLTHHDEERHSLGREVAAVHAVLDEMRAQVALISRHLMSEK